MIPFLLVGWNVLVTARNNAELNGRYEWGWRTLADRERLAGVVFPDTYGVCRVNRHLMGRLLMVRYRPEADIQRKLLEEGFGVSWKLGLKKLDAMGLLIASALLQKQYCHQIP